ncbi:HEPN domain-containing protein, partial [bacterium]|nr:HEPN domain-containing protein [bacterium]
MNDDFASATARHYCDSQLLLAEQRFDNAAYLAGYAVECGLKALIMHGGGQPRAYSHELSTLGGKALDLAVLLSPALRHYHINIIGEMLRACDGWKPELRYT